jgi:hypothetical protein
VGILTDSLYGISSGITKKDGNPDAFARAEVSRALHKIEAEKAEDLAFLTAEPIDTNAGNDDVASKAVQKRKKIVPTPYVCTDPKAIPPRAWLYPPYYIRKFAGSTVATGGAGKSSLLIGEAVAMASGRALLGIMPMPDLRVWYWNGEDPQDELKRRVQAVLQHHNVSPEDIAGRLFVDSGRDLPIRIAELKDGSTRIAVPIVNEMIEAIRDQRIDCLIVDPFVSSHGVPENDNNAIDQVAKKWADIADKTNAHIHISHHTRKTNGNGAAAEDSRGASSLHNAMRTRRVLNTMGAGEAQSAGITGNARLSYFKSDAAGSSMMKPAEALDWYQFRSINLGNGTDAYPEGDNVGVVTRWEYKAATLELSEEDTAAALETLESGGPWRESPTAVAWAGRAVAEAVGLDLAADGVKKHVVRLLAAWVSEGSWSATSLRLRNGKRSGSCARRSWISGNPHLLHSLLHPP